MAVENRTGARPRRKRKPKVRYFFLEGELHKVLAINRAQDLLTAWHYREGKTVAYVWSDARKRMGKAFTMQQVSQMIGRHRVNIEWYILRGNIREPQRIYALDGTKKPGKYMFSEKDIFELHDYLLTVHIGRPRKDGKITPGKMPSRAELRGMVNHDTVMYVKTDDDEFVPVWKEPDW